MKVIGTGIVLQTKGGCYLLQERDHNTTVFGGDFSNVIRFKDLAGPEFPVAVEEENKIMRITLPLKNGNALMGNDIPAVMGTVSENENRSKIHVAVETKEEAERIFTGLSAEGQVEVSPSDSAPDSYFGMFRDKYGIEWTVELTPAN